MSDSVICEQGSDEKRCRRGGADRPAERFVDVAWGLVWSICRSVGRALRINAISLLIVVSYMLFVWGTITWIGQVDRFRPGLYRSYLLLSLVITTPPLIAGYVFQLGVVDKEKQPFRRIGQDLRYGVFRFDRFLGVVIGLLIWAPFMSSFTSFKHSIPLMNEFCYDRIFAAIDQTIHLGNHPWQITHFLFGSTVPTLVLSFSYLLWFFAMWSVYIWQILRQHRPAQVQQFVVSFLLCWIVLGSWAAVALSSAGPCFYGRVTGDETLYQPLMERLWAMQVPLAEADGFWKIWALTTQDLLWSRYALEDTTVAAGISAMPSMHVSIAVLMAIGTWRVNRWAGAFLTVYAVIILISSVHLAWHYAIDGYVSAIVTWLIWVGSGRLVRWDLRRAGFSVLDM